jgi:predicted ATP-grasp superfamily ATP-dependent carboligase
MEKILILDSESTNSLPFLRYYHSLNYKVFAGYQHYFPISFFSRTPTIKYQYPTPGYLIDYGRLQLIEQTQINAFISSLKKFLQKNQIKYIISLSETTLMPLLLNIKNLNLKNIYPEYKIIEKLHDKSLLFKLLKNIHIKSFSLPSVYTLESLKFPCVVRPTKGMGSYHVYICKNLKEVKKAVSILKMYKREPLINEYLPSNERFIPNSLINKNGKIVRFVSSSKVSEKKIKNIVSDLEKFFKLIDYFGFASPQFLICNNKLYLTEINPRLSVWWYGLDFGVNFPEAFHKLFINKKKNVRKIFKFVKFHSFLRSSKLYLKETRDFLPVAKSFEAIAKSKIIKALHNNL